MVSALIHWLHKVNVGYDNLPSDGPKILWLIVVALPGIIMAELLAANPIIFFSGIVYLVALIVMRQYHLNGAMRNYIEGKKDEK